MSSRRIKRVIITGAGFSAPAQLPIQDRIIDKMTEEPQIDFLSGKLPQESIKFINAYITVGLFLLNNYGKGNYGTLENKYNDLCEKKYASEILQKIGKHQAKEAHVKKNFIEAIGAFMPSYDDYYSDIYSLRNEVRVAIKDEKTSVNLEDIFTSFDKSVLYREYLHKYTYGGMDEIRYSIMRLFIYYFSKCVLDHSFQQSDYLDFIKYIKTRKTAIPATIITTNWDTLMEAYFDRNDIKYYYGL